MYPLQLLFPFYICVNRPRYIKGLARNHQWGQKAGFPARPSAPRVLFQPPTSLSPLWPHSAWEQGFFMCFYFSLSWKVFGSTWDRKILHVRDWTPFFILKTSTPTSSLAWKQNKEKQNSSNTNQHTQWSTMGESKMKSPVFPLTGVLTSPAVTPLSMVLPTCHRGAWPAHTLRFRSIATLFLFY